jgi:hypothetical protein
MKLLGEPVFSFFSTCVIEYVITVLVSEFGVGQMGGAVIELTLDEH